MTRRIVKYTVPITTTIAAHAVTMPYGAELISVGSDGGQILIFAAVDPDPTLSVQPRNIRVVGGGVNFDPTGWKFIGSVQVHAFSAHVFEAPVSEPAQPR